MKHFTIPTYKHIYKRLTHPYIAGICLLISALLGACLASSPLKGAFQNITSWTPSPHFMPLTIGEWMTHGLMSVFFLLLALDIREELNSGALKQWKQAILPLVGAMGGMVVPALIATLCGILIPGSPGIQGWAIPTATDAAFTLPLLSTLPRIPSSLRAFLMALAIFDDLGAIIILALFYGQAPHLVWLCISAIPLLVLIGFNRFRIHTLRWYIIPAIFLWGALYYAGIEPTLAGVILGFCMPHPSYLPLMKRLLLPVNIVILPLFALTSVTIDVRSLTISSMISAPFLASALGLCIGKPVGIYGSIWMLHRTNIFPINPHLQGRALLGIGMICGIGFTISLLVNQLAYSTDLTLTQGQCGILAGSCLSALMGWIILRSAFHSQPAE